MHNFIMSFLIFWASFNLIFVYIAYTKIKANPKMCDFIFSWGFINGSFVWEDMFVFGIFHGLSALLALLLKDYRYWLYLYLVFWVIRSAGEVLYQFLEQFIVPKHHPHNIGIQFSPLRKVFGNIDDQKGFILLQVFLQTVLVISTSSLIMLMKFWDKVPPTLM